MDRHEKERLRTQDAPRQSRAGRSEREGAGALCELSGGVLLSGRGASGERRAASSELPIHTSSSPLASSLVAYITHALT